MNLNPFYLEAKKWYTSKRIQTAVAILGLASYTVLTGNPIPPVVYLVLSAWGITGVAQWMDRIEVN